MAIILPNSKNPVNSYLPSVARTPGRPPRETSRVQPRRDNRHERITQALNLIGYQAGAATVGKRALQRVITRREAARHAA